MTLKVTVFGGARLKPDHPAYKEAFKLGQLLGSAGYIVITGGYIGTMEAVSRGVAESGGKVIGMTCDEIESWRKTKPNPWVQKEIRYPTIRQRLMAMIDDGQVALALPGGAGTLAEISMMWNHLITGAISPRPLILIGIEWKDLFDNYFNILGEYVSLPDRAWLTFVPDVEAAFTCLNNAVSTLHC